MSDQPPRRTLCPACQRPASACICSAVRAVEHQVQVLILMHPQEAQHAKGTARLLHLCLPHSRIMVGDSFAPQVLADALTAPWGAPESAARHALLLYPPTPQDPQHPMPAPPPLPAPWLERPGRLRLVVLDGTWRQSRKMLWTHPALQQLPRLALRDVPPSRYAIRKAHAPHQLSTLEATQLALQQLEPGNHGLAQLNVAMQALMALQQAYWPAARSAMLGP